MFADRERRAESQLLEAQDALRESRERLQAALRAGGLGTFRWDIAKNEVDSDESLDRLFGLPPASTFHSLESFVRVIHPDDRASFEEHLAFSLVKRQNFEQEFRVVWPDGSTHWIDGKATVVCNNDGEPTNVTGACAEITARKMSDEALRESAERLHATFHQAAVGIAVADLDGRFVEMNEKFAAILGYEPAELERKSMFSITYAEDLPQTEHNMHDLLSGAISEYVYEKRYVRKDGSLVWSRTTVTLLRDAKGEAKRYIGAIEDISERKEAEAIRLRTEAELRTLVADNSRLYAAAQLAAQEREKLLESERIARANAEHMSSVKDEFLATLSHELRTPLSAILGWSQVLRHAPKGEVDVERGLATIERNARVQQQLIEDLLDMSRITSGKLRLDIQSVSPVAFMEAAIETIRPAASAKGIRIEQLLDPAAGPISGDPNRLQQVAWNLLSNAVKFTPKEGKLQVILQRVNSHIEICVSDTGSGIKPEFLPHVFERFRQADASSTRQHGGLGLGLSIVRHLVELHGGSVHIASPGPGMGTTVTLHFPLKALHTKTESEVRTHPTTSAFTTSDFRTTDLSGVTVVVVDDHEDTRLLVSRVLTDCGAVVYSADGAIEALRLVEALRPSVLISDIGMPDVDGYDLLKRVRSLGAERGGNVPAIALTAFARSEDRTRALRTGFSVHVTKPVEASELVVTVASAIGRSVAGEM